MKISAIVCGVLAGSLGFSGMASAALVGTPGWNAEHGGAEVQAQPQARVQGQHWQQRSAQQGQQRGDRQAWQQRNNAYQQPRYAANGQYYQNVVPYPGQPHPHFYSSRDFTYSQPHYVNSQRFYRGGYVPREYLGGGYYVSNWNAYPGLYAPPYGYQWMNVDGQFLLVALATGLIANALIAGY